MICSSEINVSDLDFFGCSLEIKTVQHHDTELICEATWSIQIAFHFSYMETKQGLICTILGNDIRR